MKEKILLGFTKNNEVVFGRIDTERGRFSASFETSAPFIPTRESILGRIQGDIEYMDKASVLYKLEYYDCKPSELAEKIYEDSYDPVEEFYDISLFPEMFTINGENVYFESGSCGQHDTRGEIEIILNEPLYNYLHELWDEYHLKAIPSDKLELLENMVIDHNENVDEYAVIEQWLKNVL